jgi:glutamate/tyrosine decarboxylase-like PLP-dependent enzyme
MSMTADYLNKSPEDGRNPTDFNPELSRRARGFAAWALLRSLGRSGVRDMIGGHCELARGLAQRLGRVDGITVANRVDCNQLALIFGPDSDPARQAHLTEAVAQHLNETGQLFLRTAVWKGRKILRVSIISGEAGEARRNHLTKAIYSAWREVRLGSGENEHVGGHQIHTA